MSITAYSVYYICSSAAILFQTNSTPLLRKMVAHKYTDQIMEPLRQSGSGSKIVTTHQPREGSTSRHLKGDYRGQQRT